ncbi:MAG: hypothetical protein JXR88_16765 [Clostridia bacterium]|nr:hypothetical protein [Clostridia bacterium]
MGSLMSKAQCQIGYQKQEAYAEMMQGRTLLLERIKSPIENLEMQI